MTIPFDQIKGLLFDKDGTLFDFQKSWSSWAHDFIATTAPDPDKQTALAKAIGFDMVSRQFDPDSAVIAGTPEETVTAVASVFPDKDLGAVRDQIVQTSTEDFQVPVTPLPALFDRLAAKGLVMGIATNDAEAAAMAHMAHFNLTPYFPFIAGYDSGHGEKPGPGQMHAFLAAQALRADHVIMIGDSTHDLEAGRAAGMFTLGVLTGIATRETLTPHADLVLPSIADLPDFFE